MNTWMNDPQYLAQIGHTLGGALIITLSCVFAGFGWGKWALAFVFVAAAVKEFWYDMKYELPEQTWGDSTMDFVFYMIGSVAGVVLMAAAHDLGKIAP